MTRLALFCGIAAFALPAAAAASAAAAAEVEQPTAFLAPVAAEASSNAPAELEEDDGVYFGMEDGQVVISVPPSMEGYGIKPGEGLVPLDDTGAVKRELCSGNHCYKVKHRHQKHYRKHKKHHKHHKHVKCIVPPRKAAPIPGKKGGPPPPQKAAPVPGKKGAAPPPQKYPAPPRKHAPPPPQKHHPAPIPMKHAAPAPLPSKKGGSSFGSSSGSRSFGQQHAVDASSLLDRSMVQPVYQQQMQQPVRYA